MVEAAKFRSTADELDAVAMQFEDADVQGVYRMLARHWREMAARREASIARLSADGADAR